MSHSVKHNVTGNVQPAEPYAIALKVNVIVKAHNLDFIAISIRFNCNEVFYK